MELNRNDWYVRLFFWSLGIWGAFRNYQYRYDPDTIQERGTNLCFFIRVMLVYMPLVLLLHAALIAAAVASLTALPIYLFGGIAYGWTLTAIAVVIGVIKGVTIMQDRAEQRKLTQIKFVFREVEETPAATEEPKGPDFWAVLWAYLVATKKKVCPSVTFFSAEGVRQ